MRSRNTLTELVPNSTALLKGHILPPEQCLTSEESSSNSDKKLCNRNVTKCKERWFVLTMGILLGNFGFHKTALSQIPSAGLCSHSFVINCYGLMTSFCSVLPYCCHLVCYSTHPVNHGSLFSESDRMWIKGTGLQLYFIQAISFPFGVIDVPLSTSAWEKDSVIKKAESHFQTLWKLAASCSLIKQQQRVVGKVKESSHAAHFWKQNLMSRMEHHKAAMGDEFVLISLPVFSAGALQAKKSPASVG